MKNAWGFAAVLVLMGAATVTFADTYYTYDGQRVPLQVDGEMVALLDSAVDKTAEGVVDLRTDGVPGWSVATLVGGARGDEVVRADVARLADAAQAAFVSPVLLAADGSPVVVTPHILVGWKAGTDRGRWDKTLRELVGVAGVEEDFAGLANLCRVKCGTRNGFEVLDAANRLAAMDGVRFAEPDFIFTGTGTATPTDPLFDLQWGMENSGQDGGLIDFDVDASEAWDITTGSGAIKVVVLDVGVQQDHPDVNLVGGMDFTTDAGNGGPMNVCDNHATWVAGCISAAMNNGVGVAGMAPATPVASARIGISNTPTCNLTWRGQLSWTVDAIMWAQTIGARVTNNSNAYNVTSSAIREAYEDTRAAGIIHFASAGNNGDSSTTYPASLAAVNGVAAVNRFGELADFSNYSSRNLSAPGQDIWTTDRTGSDGKAPGDYASVEGTSFASPISAGVAALTLSLFPELTAEELEGVIQRSCVDVGAAGQDSIFGWGLVNAPAALRLGASTRSWVAAATAGPSARSTHAMAYDGARGETVLFGGSLGFPSSRETWTWDGAAWSLASNAGPSARYGHAMVFDSVRQVVVLFGGFAGASVSGETWEWDGTGWTLASSTGPSARFLHAMAYDAGRGVAVLYGGRVGGVLNGETWEWDGTAWTQVSLVGPTARSSHAMAYDARRGVCVLFGGDIGGDETWEWDGEQWTQVVVDGPAARERHAMAYDDGAERVVMFGGFDGEDDLGETWEYDGAQWRLRSLSGPSPRQYHAMAYDAAAGRVVAFGGISESTLKADTFTWHVPQPELTVQPSGSVATPGGDAVFAVAATGTGPLDYAWYLDGVRLDDGPGVDGADGELLVLSGLQPGDGGVVEVVVGDLRAQRRSDAAMLRIVGDYDDSGAIDLADAVVLTDCMGGPAVGAAPAACGAAAFDQSDFDRDGDVDLADAAAFMAVFGL